MHVIARTRDTESPNIGIQLEAADAHKVLINTPLRTMEITELPSGELLTRCSDIQGHPVAVRNELESGDSYAITDDANPLPMTPKEAMLRVGIQGIVSTFFHERSGQPTATEAKTVLVDHLFDYTRKGLGDAPALVVTDDMVEYAARAAFNRPGAHRGCLWEDPRNRHQTTENTRDEYRENTRNALFAALEFVQHEADAPAPSEHLMPSIRARDNAARAEAIKFRTSPEGSKARHHIKTVLARHKANQFINSETVDELAKLLVEYPGLDQETAKEAPEPPAPLKFGAFWDVMQELLINGMQHLVVFRADGTVYAAKAGRGADMATPVWQVSLGNSYAGTKNGHEPLYHLSHLSSFQILGTYQNAQDVPF